MPIRRLKGALLVGEPRSKPLSIQLLLRIKQTNLSLKLSIFLYLRLISSIPIPDPKYARERYEINFDELDKIVKDNPNEQMVDVGNNHFVATHETKEYLIES